MKEDIMKKIFLYPNAGFSVLYILLIRYRRCLLRAICLLALFILHNQPLHSQTDTAKQGKVFRAGASLSNITPPLGEGIVGNFGTPPPAKHIHDQLHVRSLALDNEETKLVFAIVDNVGIKREVFDEAKPWLMAQPGCQSYSLRSLYPTGLELKAKSRLKPTFTIKLANGSYGYLPTPQQHKLSGYETGLGTNRVETEASDKITAKLLQLFAKLT
jgi:hypothetical protein